MKLSGGLNNTQGLLSSEAVLSVSVASLTNRLGSSLSSAGQLSIGSSGWIDNQGGQLVTDAGLSLSAAMTGGDPNIGSLIGGTAEKYNDQGHGWKDPTVLFGDNGAPLKAARQRWMKPKPSSAWTCMESKGLVEEILRQSQLTAKGQILINAVDGLA
ncbi:hypothetical protein [Pseudomonas sp. OV226]|uniref:hypothetical protein n=1 Tax=Pseudomonas sp. OV226 TaxID=2135588 RepID=UPI000D6BD1ED|nr:hypothetical protein [Pseudomonas sp. OV226]PWK28108.1 adhesin HecA-like repeat protein [Pseudomonas sp. OV226]